MAYARGRTLASHGMLFGPMLVDSGSVGGATTVAPSRIQHLRGCAKLARLCVPLTSGLLSWWSRLFG